MTVHGPTDDAQAKSPESLPKDELKPILINNSFILGSSLSSNKNASVNGLTSGQQSLFAAFKSRLAQNPELLDFVSGVSGGVLATTTLHPLDVLKIRLAGTGIPLVLPDPADVSNGSLSNR